MDWLVADIGGTNSRFGLCSASATAPTEFRKYPNSEFTGLAEITAHYLKETGTKPTRACMAVAAPVRGDAVALTNIDWQFSTDAMRRILGLNELLIVNDFTALATAVPELATDSASLLQIGSGTPQPQQAISVLGPGTGLGVSGLLWSPTGWQAISGEGGHVAFAPTSEIEIALLRYAQKEFSFVTAEHFLSGNGLLYLHHALADIEGRPQQPYTKPEEITRRALDNNCSECRRTVMLFCGMLGAFAGDQALFLGAFGGVYIGGGVAPQLEHLLLESDFRARFEAKEERFRAYVQPIPTYCLRTHSHIALQGAAAILKQRSAA